MSHHIPSSNITMSCLCGDVREVDRQTVLLSNLIARGLLYYIFPDVSRENNATWGWMLLYPYNVQILSHSSTLLTQGGSISPVSEEDAEIHSTIKKVLRRRTFTARSPSRGQHLCSFYSMHSITPLSEWLCVLGVWVYSCGSPFYNPPDARLVCFICLIALYCYKP